MRIKVGARGQVLLAHLPQPGVEEAPACGDLAQIDAVVLGPRDQLVRFFQAGGLHAREHAKGHEVGLLVHIRTDLGL